MDSPTDSTPVGSPLSNMANVMAAPAEVFEGVGKVDHRAGNWLWPLILNILIGIITMWVLFSQDWFMHKVLDIQSVEMQKKVAEGTMTKEAAKQTEDIMEKMGPTLIKGFGAAGVVLGAVATPFLWGLILMLLSRLIGSKEVYYMKFVEIAGLASVVYSLNFLVGFLLTMTRARIFQTPSLALFLPEMDISNKFHMALGAINIIYIWFAVILGIGLAVLRDGCKIRSICLVLIFWVVTRVAFIGLGWGQFVL